jgi:hypothetical protein
MRTAREYEQARTGALARLSEPITEQEAIAFLTVDGGRVPVSRYGWDSTSCAPIAWACAVILSGETGEPITADGLEWLMGLVVNDHDDPAYMVASYGAEYGFSVDDYLEPEDYEHLLQEEPA